MKILIFFFLFAGSAFGAEATITELELRLEIIQLKKYAAQVNLERADLLQINSHQILREAAAEEQRLRKEIEQLKEKAKK